MINAGLLYHKSHLIITHSSSRKVCSIYKSLADNDWVKPNSKKPKKNDFVKQII